MTDSTKEWPEFVQGLNKYYTVHTRGWKTTAGYKLFLADFSEWKLRFSNPTPIIWVNAEAAELRPAELLESLQDVAREQGWRHGECIVLLDREEQGLKSLAANRYLPRFVIIDSNDQHDILEASSFTNDLLDLICDQVPISDLAPYEISKPVTGTRFFGRSSDIQKVIMKSDTNFAVIGPKRIGKTSLLREINRRLKEQTEKGLTAAEGPYVFLDCSLIKTPYTFLETLVQKLWPKEISRLHKRTPEVFFIRFIERMHKVFKSPITIFLDEVDRWFAPANRNQIVLDMFRVSSESEDCRYIVAGFTNLMKETQIGGSTFFKKMFEYIELGPFTKKDLTDLVLTPMTQLRIQIKQQDEVVERIYKETGGIPQLAQYYCLDLIDQLDSQETHQVTPDNLSGIQKKTEFKNLVLGSFQSGIDAEDRCLVYALLTTIPVERDAESFTQQEMSNALNKCGLSFSPEKIDQICDRLSLCGIMTNENDKYRFSIPFFPRVLRMSGLDYLFSEAKKEMVQ
ncbi:MAG: orc1/cdc6 family replication initiation protein [Candidatus Aminicenantes bacterium]|nr:MAG: orc1/cdc6 family replication initiation protein [Candidatus Aminicenantes bacterium]